MSTALPAPSIQWFERTRHLVYRARTGPRRFFGAPDVFISYCRRDGSAYAEALANHLASKRFDCFIDQWHAEPGTRTPPQALRAARWSRALVVLATREALKSPSMDEEIREFKILGGPIVLVVFPGVPFREACWYGLVCGVMEEEEPGGEQARVQGSPAASVQNRIRTSLTFRKRNQRIAWGAGIGTAWVVIAFLLGLALWNSATIAARRTLRMTRLSNAVELAMRADDRLANDPGQSVEALRLGVRSLASTPTEWGESAVRRGLMLLPAFRGTVSLPQPGNAAFGPGGVLAQWSRDPARSEAAGYTVSRLALTGSRSGIPVHAPVEVPGYVRDVYFTPGGAGIVVGVGSTPWALEESVRWIPLRGGTPRSFEVEPAGAFAVDPAEPALVVANGSVVRRWALGELPVAAAEWRLPGVRALAFSPDGSRLFALRSDRIVSIDPRDPAAPPVTLARVANSHDATLLATEGHVVLVTDSVRTWTLAGARWDHAFDLGESHAAVPGDRLAVWSRSGATFWDLSLDGAGLYTGAIHAGCDNERGRKAELRHLAVTADGRRAALACGDGTAKVVSTADGTLLAVAPGAGAIPGAVHLDGGGSDLLLYDTSARAAAPAARARVASWKLVNGTSHRIGGDGAPLVAEAFALDAGGGSLAAVFANGSGAGNRLAVFDPLTGRETAAADGSLAGWSFRMASHAGHVAVASEREVSLWKVERRRLRLRGSFGVENAIALQFGGADARYLAISSARGDGVEVTVLERGPDGWRRRPSIAAGSWTLARPDRVVFSPVAVSAAGWVAHLAPGDADLAGSRVAVTRGAGAPVTLRHGSAVTLLRFAGPETLVTATHSGEIWSWALDAPEPVPRRIGRHESAVLALAAGAGERVLAIDRGNVIRMWALDTSTRDVGLRGYMEFPVNRFGVWNHPALGTRALAFSGERLVTVNQHARGLFAVTWVIPRQERLAAAVAERLGGFR